MGRPSITWFCNLQRFGFEMSLGRPTSSRTGILVIGVALKVEGVALDHATAPKRPSPSDKPSLDPLYCGTTKSTNLTYEASHVRLADMACRCGSESTPQEQAVALVVYVLAQHRWAIKLKKRASASDLCRSG